MLKLYKQIDGVLHDHEAWAKGRSLYEHYGIVGKRCIAADLETTEFSDFTRIYYEDPDA